MFHAVAEHALLIEFGDRIDTQIHAEVLRLDATLAGTDVVGLRETVPAYASLLIAFDPLLTDHRTMERAVLSCLSHPSTLSADQPTQREVAVCYDAALSPDLTAVSKAAGLTEEQVIVAHLSGDYQVFMYGFAPGYAYLAGVPDVLQMPRKSTPVRGVAAGSVMIAGPQCLVSTLNMPTGWWVIGRSPTKILTGDASRPFLFDVGDRVTFHRISRAEFARAEGSR